MKKLLLTITIFMCLFIFSIPAFADSPITSTQFSDAYQDVSIVKEASQKGIVNANIAAYLSNTKNPIDVKAAVINALSWDIDGKSNSDTYTKLIYKKSVSVLKPETLSADQQFCIGYMMAMDDYLDTANTLKYLKLAEKKINNSFTVSVIRALVDAQNGNESTWTYIQPLLNNKNLKMDMRQDAVNIIFDYMAGDFLVSQNNFIIENEKSQRVYLYGTYSDPSEIAYEIVSQSDKAATALSKDKYGIYYLDITGIENGNSSIQIKNIEGTVAKINFTVVSKETYKKLDNLVSMYIGSTYALIGNTKATLNSTAVPYIKANKQYISIDFINKAVGATMQYDKKKGNYNITYAGKTISFKSGSNVVSINGKSTKLSANIETNSKLLFITAQDYASITGKKYAYYNGLILISDTKTIFDPIKEDYILIEISNLLNNGKSVLNYPTLYIENNKYGYKDSSGKVVIKPTYEDAFEFSEGVAAVAVKNEQGSKKYGFIDLKGNFVLNPIYNWANSFAGGLAPIVTDDYAGFINKSGTVKSDINYNGVGGYSSGLAAVMDPDGDKWGYIDTTGKLVIPYKFDDSAVFSENLAAVKVGEKWGCIDRTGKIVIQPAFDEPVYFLNGTADVKLNGDYYTINRTGDFCVFYDDGDIYMGGSNNGLMEGKGVYTWADGRQYSGDFLKGELTGNGTLIYQDGTKQEGAWKSGEFIGQTK